MENRSITPGASGRWRFIGRSIRVTIDTELGLPVSFVFDGTERRIADIPVSWFDWGFAAGAKQRDWKSRRHRKYFRVVDHTGDVFEIYQDRRGADRAGEWVCYQQWVPEVEH